ncbi:MAG TPA: KH domain-containing protein [Verrucomicrobiae bacterium]|nr:KH domain-containing protein [Verrucomicrobiae bacterium]
MSEIDQQFIEYVVKSLVGKPDAVHIDRRIDEKGVLLELTVDPEDLGRVIGKRGATAQSLRTLLRALGTKNDARYNLKIIDNGTPDQTGSVASDDAQQPAKDEPAIADDTATDDESAETAVSEEPTEPETEAEPTSEQESEPESVEADAEDKPEDKPEPGSRLAKTRQELADLDDLDV